MRHQLQIGNVAIVVTLLFIVCGKSFSQKSVEAYGAIGGTAVDVEKWAGLSPNDWGTGMSGWSLQAFLVGNDVIAGGLEYGYSYLMWYTFNDGNFNIERNVEANRIMLMGRLFPNKSFLTEFGLGLYLFDGFSDFSVAGGIGYKFNITDQLSIPIKIRVDAVLDPEAFLLPIGINGGVAYRF